MIFVATSVLFTNNLARQLQAEEQKNMAIWVDATRQLIFAEDDADIDFVSSYTGIPKDRVLEDPRRNFAEYRLVLLGMARMEQGYRWITPVVVDRLDKAIARGEWKRL